MINMTEIPIELIKIEPAIATSIYEELLGKMIQKTLHLICVASTDSESIYQKHIISTKRGNNAIFKKEHNLNKLTELVNSKREAATFYPFYFCSLIPEHTDDIKLTFFIKDLVINANEARLKTPHIAILIDRELMARRMEGSIKEILRDEEMIFLKKITIYHL
jgi:hypothetical protein